MTWNITFLFSSFLRVLLEPSGDVRGDINQEEVQIATQWKAHRCSLLS